MLTALRQEECFNFVLDLPPTDAWTVHEMESAYHSALAIPGAPLGLSCPVFTADDVVSVSEEETKVVVHNMAGKELQFLLPSYTSIADLAEELRRLHGSAKYVYLDFPRARRRDAASPVITPFDGVLSVACFADLQIKMQDASS